MNMPGNVAWYLSLISSVTCNAIRFFVRPRSRSLQVLEVLKEAHEWLCKENEPAVRKTLEERGWNAAYDLQPDVPYPERPAAIPR